MTLLHANSDPLGTIASVAKAYTGEFHDGLSQITDNERQHYFEDVRKNVLLAPLEFVSFHFLIDGVTRSFTHQMVRQRTATYAQESLRFAVKDELPVGLPPSLEGTVPWREWWTGCYKELFGDTLHEKLPQEQAWERLRMADAYAEETASKEQVWRRLWDEHVQDTETTYNGLVDTGMPAEDARGLLPHATLTRLHYTTDLRHLIDHAGLRLCTQAQFEWRLVWTGIIEAIREYGKTQQYTRPYGDDDNLLSPVENLSAAWQFDAIAGLFKPICYKTGKCEFMSEHDRYCSIRERVNAYASEGIPSTEWDKGFDDSYRSDGPQPHIAPIKDEEWLADPTAARE